MNHQEGEGVGKARRLRGKNWMETDRRLVGVTRLSPKRQAVATLRISQEEFSRRLFLSRKIMANRMESGSGWLSVFLPHSNLITRRLFWPWAVISGFVFLPASPTSTCLLRGPSQGYCKSREHCVTPMQAN